MTPKNISSQSEVNVSDDPNAQKNQEETYLNAQQGNENENDLLSSQEEGTDETVLNDDEDLDDLESEDD